MALPRRLGPRHSVRGGRKIMTKLDTKSRAEIPPVEFAFAEQRKEPLENATHVRNAIARFNQVSGVTDVERDGAWRKILLAAEKFGVHVHESSWRELGLRRLKSL
jgi:hypothetical protein